MRHYCFLYNVVERCVNRGPEGWLTPYEVRFGPFLSHKIIPFGAEVSYLPANPEDKAKQPQLELNNAQDL